MTLSPATREPELTITGLTVAYGAHGGAERTVVRDVDLELYPHEILGVAGESGCGKSTTSLAGIGYRAPGARILAGRCVLNGVDLLTLSHRQLRDVWGRTVAYVAQDAAGALNPLHRVGDQVAETLLAHHGIRAKEARPRVLKMLEAVGIPDPESAVRRYPHEFSGGQQQRLALAAAMIDEPQVLILDEPTTGLDVTTRRQIIELIRRLVDDFETAALHISHDLSLLATSCDKIAVMYAGEIVERGPALTVYSEPRHPYAAALLAAVPKVDDDTHVVGIPGLPPLSVALGRCSFADRCAFVQEKCRAQAPELRTIPGTSPSHEARCLRLEELGALRPSGVQTGTRQSHAAAEPLLQLKDVTCSYRSGPGQTALEAVRNVTLTVSEGETLALVGESGSGKSTMLRAIAGLHRIAAGEMQFDGGALAPDVANRRRWSRQAIQLVPQDPNASLNPRHRVREILERPLRLFQPELGRRQRLTRVAQLLDDVRLDFEIADVFPQNLSGGQRQRVALARAFAAAPRLLLCDEVTSALDVSVQASILELVRDLARQRGASVLFVTHDLAVVRQVSDRVSVMRNGEIFETADTHALFESPQSDYTRALLAAVPTPGQAAHA